MTGVIQAGNGFGWAVVGFAPNAEPRSIPVTVAGRDPAGNQADVSETLQVVTEAFPSDAVQVEPAQGAQRQVGPLATAVVEQPAPVRGDELQSLLVVKLEHACAHPK